MYWAPKPVASSRFDFAAAGAILQRADVDARTLGRAPRDTHVEKVSPVRQEPRQHVCGLAVSRVKKGQLGDSTVRDRALG